MGQPAGIAADCRYIWKLGAGRSGPIGFLKPAQPLAQLLHFIEKVQHESGTSRVHPKIPRQALCDHDTPDATAAESPLGRLTTNWLNQAFVNQLHDTLGSDSANLAQIGERQLTASLNNFTLQYVVPIFFGHRLSLPVPARIEVEGTRKFTIRSLLLIRLCSRQGNLQDRVKITGFFSWKPSPLEA
jgi:hypothetical protein